ncbi:hypothetical protein QAD02_018174 [Eretmocerus hayati]|uniref:Uncharacterized protein n=1 Tax=Eretmocerus hayati TaxID=131215 RepID=A0ACC2PFX8_9HYME|nr:hypothetical protein QAD02_018174 [Eretmocerus hayati]
MLSPTDRPIPSEIPKSENNLDSDMMDTTNGGSTEHLYISNFSSSNPFNVLIDNIPADPSNLSITNSVFSADARSRSPPPKRQRDGSQKSHQRRNDGKLLTPINIPLDPACNVALPGDGDDNLSSCSPESETHHSSLASPQQPQQQQQLHSEYNAADVRTDPKIKQQKQPVQQLYSEENSGPFVVFIEPIDLSLVKGKLNPTTVGRIIGKKIGEDRYSCQSSGKQKITVTAGDPEAANTILRDPTLTLHNLRASAPVHRLNRQGIIREVPLDIPDNAILLSLQSPSQVLKVKRLMRNKTEASNEKTLVPTQSIQITFDGQHLPPRVRLYGVSHRVEPFIQPVKMCFQCYRYGHIRSQCRSSQLCGRCGTAKHNSEDECPQKDGDPVCINCQGSHEPDNKCCPEYQLQRDARALAAQENITFKQAYARIIRNSPPEHTIRVRIIPEKAPNDEPAWSNADFPRLTPSLSTSFAQPSHFPLSTTSNVPSSSQAHRSSPPAPNPRTPPPIPPRTPPRTPGKTVSPTRFQTQRTRAAPTKITQERLNLFQSQANLAPRPKSYLTQNNHNITGSAYPPSPSTNPFKTQTSSQNEPSAATNPTYEYFETPKNIQDFISLLIDLIATFLLPLLNDPNNNSGASNPIYANLLNTLVGLAPRSTRNGY